MEQTSTTRPRRPAANSAARATAVLIAIAAALAAFELMSAIPESELARTAHAVTITPSAAPSALPAAETLPPVSPTAVEDGNVDQYY